MFAFTLMVMIILEHALPARRYSGNALKHNLDNLLLGASGTILLRLVPGILAAHLALQNELWQIGISYSLDLPQSSLLFTVSAVVFLDFCIYWQHRYFHYNKYLWRLHRVHHSDTMLSASSALRFHPLEILLSMLIKSALVLGLGIPFVAVVLFEILLNACAIFNHTNIRLPKRFEQIFRRLVVTPSMHRIHHSTDLVDSNRNFGFCLSVWDRAFNSYAPLNSSGINNFVMGVKEVEKTESEGLASLITQPFKQQR